MKNIDYKQLIINIKNNPKKLILISSIILVIIILTIILVIIFNQLDNQKYIAYTGENLSNNKYPGYKELLDKLLEEHPNWNFVLFYTKLDWEEVISNEGHVDNRVSPLNLIPDSSKYPSDWKCEVDKDKTFDNGTWLCAANKAIKYVMDPRNILNDDEIFQFLELSYAENSYSVSGINSITKSSFLEGDNISNTLIQASKNANIDPYFVTSRLIQEQGRKGTVLSTGYEYNDTIVFNPFNVKASRKFSI